MIYINIIVQKGRLVFVYRIVSLLWAQYLLCKFTFNWVTNFYSLISFADKSAQVMQAYLYLCVTPSLR